MPCKKMKNFSNYFSLVTLIFFIIKTCTTYEVKIRNSATTESDDNSGSEDTSESGLDIDHDICALPIDVGDCEAESLATHENGLSDNAIKEVYAINDLYEVKELYEINERNRLKKLDGLSKELKDHNERHNRYFGYNKSSKKCEEFNYDGCGGNDNRFASLSKCRRTCYTPLKYFLSEVIDLLLFKFKQYSSEVPTT